MLNPQTFKWNFAEASASGDNSAQKNCETIFRAKLKLKLDQNFANFLLPAWKSLLIYIQLSSSISNFSCVQFFLGNHNFFVQYFCNFFAEILHSLAKHITPKFCAKSGNLRIFFYIWDAQKCRMCRGKKIAEFSHNYFLFRWKYLSQFKDLTSHKMLLNADRNFAIFIFVFFKIFFYKQSNCLVFIAL